LTFEAEVVDEGWGGVCFFKGGEFYTGIKVMVRNIIYVIITMDITIKR